MVWNYCVILQMGRSMGIFLEKIYVLGEELREYKPREGGTR